MIIAHVNKQYIIIKAQVKLQELEERQELLKDQYKQLLLQVEQLQMLERARNFAENQSNFKQIALQDIHKLSTD